VTDPRRNVELKAVDPDPEETLRRALAAGAEDRGLLRQRDTYFAVSGGRLKLREQDDGATLIAYRRADEARERPSAYHLVSVPDPGALRAALGDVPGVRVVVEKHRRLLIWERTVRIHLDTVTGLDGAFVEIEAVAGPGSDLAREHDQVARLRAILTIADDMIRGGSYSDLLAGGPDEELLALARAARARAYAPYSNFPVGAALRTTDGHTYSGANVENAAFPQGQCAEASAIGAMVAGGGGRIAAVAVAGEEGRMVTPCGGCRQRLREFAGDAVPIHLGTARTVTLGELLPLSFGPEDL